MEIISDLFLQWGRGFNTAERECRGSKRQAVHAFNGAAALTPRREKHLPLRDSRPILQWGRGFNTAESEEVRVNNNDGAYLQWGRGFNTAERRSPASRCTRGTWGTSCERGVFWKFGTRGQGNRDGINTVIHVVFVLQARAGPPCTTFALAGLVVKERTHYRTAGRCQRTLGTCSSPRSVHTDR